ncbi:hypothetical protein KIF59_03860 [Enterobacter cloacae subsp. cloacae]|nr:hypothetical protein [Enterobacter cloacae subsp. cloacae]
MPFAAVTGINALIERGREALTRPDVVRAEGCDPSFRGSVSGTGILGQPTPEPLLVLDGVHLIAFGLSQFLCPAQPVYYQPSLRRANSPDTATIFIGREVVTLLIQKLVEDYGCSTS